MSRYKSPPVSQEGIDLFRQCVVAGYPSRQYIGAFPDMTAAKKRVRIDYRGGQGGTYIALDRRTGRPIEEFEPVGNRARNGHADTVRLWPTDDEPTPPATAAEAEAA